MKPTKNKKRNNPRYHLNEAYGIPPAGDISAFGPLSREVPEESGMSGPKEISQSAFKSASNSGLMKPTVEDEEMLSAVFPQKEIIDPRNYADIQRVTYKQPHGDPNAIIPLGSTSDGSVVYAKTADGVYYEIPRG